MIRHDDAIKGLGLASGLETSVLGYGLGWKVLVSNTEE